MTTVEVKGKHEKMSGLCEAEILLAEEGPEDNLVRVIMHCKRLKNHPGVHSHANESIDGKDFGITWT